MGGWFSGHSDKLANLLLSLAKHTSNDSYSPFNFSGDNAMIHGQFQKIETLDTGVQALENLPCGTLGKNEQLCSFQVPPVAERKRESRRRQVGNRCITSGFPSRQFILSSSNSAGRDLFSELNKSR